MSDQRRYSRAVRTAVTSAEIEAVLREVRRLTKPMGDRQPAGAKLPARKRGRKR